MAKPFPELDEQLRKIEQHLASLTGEGEGIIYVVCPDDPCLHTDHDEPDLERVPHPDDLVITFKKFERTDRGDKGWPKADPALVKEWNDRTDSALASQALSEREYDGPPARTFEERDAVGHATWDEKMEAICAPYPLEPIELPTLDRREAAERAVAWAEMEKHRVQDVELAHVLAITEDAARDLRRLKG